MFSLMNTARTVLSKLVSLIYSGICLLLTGPTVPRDMPKTPEDFTPVLRFMVCSDIHINDEITDQKEPDRFVKAVETAYAYAKAQKYSSLDAVCVAGDFTDQGKREQYEIFISCAEKALNDSTRLLICSGNHEYIEYREDPEQGAEVGALVYEEMLGRSEDEHNIINGYHFISVSYDSNGDTFKGKKKWLDNEIKKAVSDTGDKPIFVFQHPAPFGTVYGSIHWGDLTISEVLSKYPQVIDFSGHSHYPINDPRSIWQGTFTALGCGTLSYFETEIDYIAGNYPYESENAAQFYIVEADAQGNVRVLGYDLITDGFFGNEYYLTGLAQRNYDYTFNKMKARDSIPVFEEGASVGTYKNDEGNTILTFDGAKSSFIVESYKISVCEYGLLKAAEANISGKYMYLYMDDAYSVDLGKLKSGHTYTVEIVALNAYSQTSAPLKYTFTAT